MFFALMPLGDGNTVCWHEIGFSAILMPNPVETLKASMRGDNERQLALSLLSAIYLCQPLPALLTIMLIPFIDGLVNGILASELIACPGYPRST